MNATCVLENKNPSCCWGVPTVGSPLYPKASVRLQVAERKQFSRMTTILFTPWWHCYFLVNARINIGMPYEVHRHLSFQLSYPTQLRLKQAGRKSKAPPIDPYVRITYPDSTVGSFGSYVPLNRLTSTDRWTRISHPVNTHVSPSKLTDLPWTDRAHP